MMKRNSSATFSRFAKPTIERAIVTAALALAWLCLPYEADAQRSHTALSALLQRQTEAFSEASQTGDYTTMASYLDDNVVFVNENGQISSREDFIAAVGSPHPVSDSTAALTDWQLRLHGGGAVATATFVDVVTRNFHGQTLVLRFRSTETWIRRRAGWKMIASQTMTVPQDPPTVRLSEGDLREYVGVYEMAASYRAVIDVRADALTIAIDGQPPAELHAELRDVFFVPGASNLRRLFERDSSGRVVRLIMRHDGVSTVLTRSGPH